VTDQPAAAGLGAADPRAYVRLAAELRRQIADGRLPAGRPVPSISALGAQYGHSRQTCAKAMRLLEGEGLVARFPGLGYFTVGQPGRM
jgi:GntR family transcriptional regulator